MRFLARNSLWMLVGMLALQSCLVAEPPLHRQPDQTPPILNLSLASPSIQKIITAVRPITLKFSVPLRSEDAGEQLTAQMYVDIDSPAKITTTSISSQAVVPAGFEEIRNLSLDWSIPETTSAECHSVTLVICHSKNYLKPPPAGSVPCSAEPRDMAIATWWVNVLPPEGSDIPPSTCPPRTGGP